MPRDIYVGRILAAVALFLMIGAVWWLAQSIPMMTGSPEPVIMQGGKRTERGITMDTLEAISQSKNQRIQLVLQFDRIITPEEMAALESRFGIDIREYMPVDAYVVSLPTGMAIDILQALESAHPPLLAAYPIRPADKLSPTLGEPGAIEPPWHQDDDGWISVFVSFHQGVTRQDQNSLLSMMPGEIGDAPIGMNVRDNMRQLGLTAEQIDILLLSDLVRWIESPPPQPFDDLGGPDGQISARKVAGFNGGLGGGEGVLIAQWENCPPHQFHPALKNRVSLGAGTAACTQLDSEHSTLVTGIMIGDGSNSRDGQHFGLATVAEVIAYKATSSPITLEDNYRNAMSNGAVISQNSWGFECEFLTNPKSKAPHAMVSALYDRVSSGRNDLGDRSFLYSPMLIVTSAGNYGSETNISSVWGSVRAANSGKNVLSVGNVNAQSPLEPDNWAHSSSGRGPTRDGRLAPLLSAPGIRFEPVANFGQPPTGGPSVNSEPSGIYSTIPPDLYQKDYGTSFSAPFVSGAAALLTETYRDNCAANPTPAELRALLIHTALDLKEARSMLSNFNSINNCSLESPQNGPEQSMAAGQLYPPDATSLHENRVYEGPDYVFGYGLLQTDKALGFTARSHHLRDEISQGMLVYEIDVDESVLENGKLRVTLAWDDPPWPFNGWADPTFGTLQNDLDLELIDPLGMRHLPWLLDPNQPAEPADQHRRIWLLPVNPKLQDHRNTIEQIEVEVDPSRYGTWKMRVRAGRMLRPPQSYALVSRAIVPASACAGLQAQAHKSLVQLPHEKLYRWLFWIAFAMLLMLALLMLNKILLEYPLLQNIWQPHQNALWLIILALGLIFISALAIFGVQTLILSIIMVILLFIAAMF